MNVTQMHRSPMAEYDLLIFAFSIINRKPWKQVIIIRSGRTLLGEIQFVFIIKKPYASKAIHNKS